MYIAECGRMMGTDELEMQTGVDELIESLIRSLEDDDLKVRGGVIQRLDRTGDERSVEPLITRLSDRSQVCACWCCTGTWQDWRFEGG